VPSILETDEWIKSARALGDAERVEEALAPIFDGLFLNPEGFPQAPGRPPEYRIAKTDPSQSETGREIPAVSVWLRIERGFNRVCLLYVEIIPDDDDDGDV
jgi:hypothetical protein